MPRRWMPAALAAGAIFSLVGAIRGQFSGAIDKYAGTLKARRGIAAGIPTGQAESLYGLGGGMFAPEEVLQQARPLTRAVGVRGQQFPKAALNTILTSVVEDMIEFPQAQGFMKTLVQAGVPTQQFVSEGGQGIRIYKKVTTDAFASGLEKGRFGEHLENVDMIAQSIGQAQPGRIDAAAISSLLAELGAIGPGFRGERGRGTLATLQQGFMTAAMGGGDPAARALMLQSQGFGMPGAGRVSFFEAIRGLEEGLTADNLKKALDVSIRAGGISAGENPAEYAGFILKNMFKGLSQTRSEALLEAFMAGGADLEKNPALRKQLKLAQEETKPLDKQTVEELQTSNQINRELIGQGKELFKVSQDIRHELVSLIGQLLPVAKDILLAVKDLVRLVSKAVEAFKSSFTAEEFAETQVEKIRAVSDPDEQMKLLKGNLEAARLAFKSDAPLKDRNDWIGNIAKGLRSKANADIQKLTLTPGMEMPMRVSDQEKIKQQHLQSSYDEFVKIINEDLKQLEEFKKNKDKADQDAKRMEREDRQRREREKTEQQSRREDTIKDTLKAELGDRAASMITSAKSSGIPTPHVASRSKPV